jgi:hypothetical protein
MAAGVQMSAIHSPPTPRSGLLLAVLVATLSMAVSGCGSGSAGGSSAKSPLPVLPASALAGLTTVDSSLSAVDLTHDAPIAGFADSLSQWDYRGGTQRVFRGSTGVFTNVVSRTLEFGSAEGAAAYVRLVDTRVADFYGRGSKVTPLSQGGRTGYLIQAAPCGCHRETPVLLAVLSAGPRVTWLYGTGPGARPARLRALLPQAP